MLQIAVVRSDAPKAEHDESDRHREGERLAGDGRGRGRDRAADPGHGDEYADRQADDQEHRPEDREDDPAAHARLRAERRGHAIRIEHAPRPK